MTQTQTIKRLERRFRREVEGLARLAYREGFEAGIRRAKGLGRRGRTIRKDATVESLVREIERHFGLDRYGFEVRIVHRGSGRRVPAGDLISRYRAEPPR